LHVFDNCVDELKVDFLNVFKMIETVAPLRGSYDPWRVGTSVAIAVLAAFTALSVASRMVAAASWQARCAWASAGAGGCSLGGIWGMHIIGMLAFSLPCGISYDPLGTLASVTPGILASGVALQVISHSEPSLTRRFLGAVLMRAGIGAMYYPRRGGEAACRCPGG
jgi:two-component system, sensor histidine kinase and response regulator